ncbi:hypothetical protein TNCV_774311 [Trichonephila clavipes]|nr:hypothetical protein TNCV_774311 [Trichonephila clavipes]
MFLQAKKDFGCGADIVSISSSPDRNLFTDFGSSPIPAKAFDIANGDFLNILLVAKVSDIHRNFVYRKERKEKCMTRKTVENREGFLGYPGVVTFVFAKDSKPLRKRLLGHLGIVTHAFTERRGASFRRILAYLGKPKVG